MCSSSVRTPPRADIPLAVTQTAALAGGDEQGAKSSRGGGGELLSCLFNIYISCPSHSVYEFYITSRHVKASAYVKINSVCVHAVMSRCGRLTET